MSESLRDNTATLHQRTRLIIITVMAVITLLGFGYLGGYFILPNTIKSAYQDNNCEKVLSRNDTYAGIYPSMVRDENLAEPVRECAVFTLALTYKEEGAWRDSYNALTVYAETYPDGRFTIDVHEHIASVLIELAKEEITQNKYVEALENINLVLSDYGDTEAVEGAESLKFDLYTTWGTDQRDAGDFAEAERIFNEAQNNTGTGYAKSSQRELAQTYLLWGQALQSQEKFVEAKLKFDTAVSTDPDSLAGSGPAGEAKANQVKLYTQWGDYLVEQGDYANAMGHYETAAILTRNDDPTAADDIIANGYVQWAAGLSAEEDFTGALILLGFAQESAATDTTKTLVDSARSDLYLALSKSTGEQAQKAMQDAVKIVCEHHIQPSLPIYALDEDNIRAGVYGAGDDQLPESIAAMTPASLHYVSCIEEDIRLVGTLSLPISNTQFGGSPGVTRITYANFQYIWNVVLRKIDSGEEIETTVIEGVEPVKLEPFKIDIPTFNYYGPKPDIVDLGDWIGMVIE